MGGGWFRGTHLHELSVRMNLSQSTLALAKASLIRGMYCFGTVG